jgi:hypothetical protein
MRRTCRTYCGEKGWGNLRESDHLEDSGADGSIVLKWIFKKGDGGEGMDWIDLDHDRYMCGH